MSDPSASTVWAVVGGSGFIGRNIVRVLSDDSNVVRALSGPRLSVAGEYLADVVSAAGSAEANRAVAQLAEQLAGCDVVVNAAGLAVPNAVCSPELVGANSLLPVVIARAAALAGVRRVIHLSSAAVQDRVAVLTESSSVSPATPYAHSKALGESALREASTQLHDTEVVVLRATSVHGVGRATTQKLQRMAGSRLASVAGSGERPTPVASVAGLVEAVRFLGMYAGPVPFLVLQPSEGHITTGGLRALGAKEPHHTPRAMCRAVLAVGYWASAWAGHRGRDQIRRLEVMWFGQRQDPGWLDSVGFRPSLAAVHSLAVKPPHPQDVSAHDPDATSPIAGLVSIVTPAHNVSEYLTECLDSVLSQTYERWEHILVDDASTDDTWQLISERMESDPRVVGVRLPTNRGAAAARNEAISRARGQYVAFLDGDDYWYPEKLKRQLEFMEARGIGLCYSSYSILGFGGETVRRTPPRATYRELLKTNFIGCSTAIYDVYECGRVYMPDVEKRQDMALWLRITRTGVKAEGVPEALATYRIRPNSLSSNKLSAAHHVWKLYREVEHLSLPVSARYFSEYAVRALLKYGTIFAEARAKNVRTHFAIRGKVSR